MDKLKLKLNAVYTFILDRLGEASTWQAIFFCVGLFGGKYVAGLDTANAAAAGGLLSAFLKAVIPDKKV